uniref:hypothetical protein n=1 Tax=Actinomadura sp. CA-154981 TaxID=3240037 RepID=UPI003F495B27
MLTAPASALDLETGIQAAREIAAAEQRIQIALTRADARAGDLELGAVPQSRLTGDQAMTYAARPEDPVGSGCRCALARGRASA